MEPGVDLLTDAELLAKQAWLGRPLSERQAHMKKIIITHPEFSNAVSEIERRKSRVRAQMEGEAFSVVVPTGAGKTTLGKFLASRWPDRVEKELTIRPSVTFKVPTRPSTVSMSSAVLKALGDPKWERGRSDVLQGRAIKLLRDCQSEFVYIDNAHDIPERRATSKGVREVGNWIRDMVDEVPALFIAAGAEVSLEVFKANSQARRRTPAHLRIGYFDCRSKGGVGRLRRFLLELDKRLPLAEMSDLSEFAVAKRIWIASYGITDYIIKILTEAIEIVVKDMREALTLPDLAKAFNKFYQNASTDLNPFTCKDEELRLLDLKDEPFERWLDDGYA